MPMNNPHSTADLFQRAVDYYRGYAARNETFMEFAEDVNTLGGTLELGVTHIDTTKTHATVSDDNFTPIARYPLWDIWNALKGDQLSLL
jgi:hypothetical protein